MTVVLGTVREQRINAEPTARREHPRRREPYPRKKDTHAGYPYHQGQIPGHMHLSHKNHNYGISAYFGLILYIIYKFSESVLSDRFEVEAYKGGFPDTIDLCLLFEVIIPLGIPASEIDYV